MTKVLLVEDDKSLREIYGVRLLAEGYDIVSAGDGEEALAMAIKEKPQLIISDVMMPKISGFDMLDILRSTTETKNIKVIMMTALSSDDQRARGEQLGADKYLVKSQVGIEDVVRTVHEVLEDGSSNTSTAVSDTSAPQQEEKPAENSQPVDHTEVAPVTSDVQADQSLAEPTVSETSSNNLESNSSDIQSTPELKPEAPEIEVTPAPGNDDAGPLPPQPTESWPPVDSASEAAVPPVSNTEMADVSVEAPDLTPPSEPAWSESLSSSGANDSANDSLGSSEEKAIVNNVDPAANEMPAVSSVELDSEPQPSPDNELSLNPSDNVLSHELETSVPQEAAAELSSDRVEEPATPDHEIDAPADGDTSPIISGPSESNS